jgi:dTDP-4-amino-4,6-dideoxygalactose transaminase
MTANSEHLEFPAATEVKEQRVDRLAIDGGRPFRLRPFAPWPSVSPEEIEAANSVLRSGRLNYWTGTEGRNFETEFASFLGSRRAVAVANGTVALELALYGLGIAAGDEVIVTSRTFVASASCAVMRNATPVFADVDPISQNITAASIRQVLSPRTKAIIAVHLAGWPCDMDPIMALARERGLKVVEDCAQAHGARYKGRTVGSIGDVGAFSFCQDKIMTTGGEGGMLTTDKVEVWERVWSFKDHGKSYRAVNDPSPSLGFRWLHESFGTNMRLTEVQSALGRVLITTLPQHLRIRRRNAAILTTRFATLPALRVTIPPPEIDHAYYKYYAFVRPELLRAGWNRDQIMQAIVAEGVPCFTGSCSEIYLEKAFPERLRPLSRLPVARQLGETSLMFPVHPTLAENDMLDIAGAVEKVFKAASVPSASQIAA